MKTVGKKDKGHVQYMNAPFMKIIALERNDGKDDASRFLHKLFEDI